MNFFEFLQRQLLEAFYKKILFLKVEQNSQENGYAKKRLSHRCFTVNFSRFLGIAFLQNRACNFVKKETSAKPFYLEVCKIFKDSFLKNTSGSFFFNLRSGNQQLDTAFNVKIWLYFYLYQKFIQALRV